MFLASLLAATVVFVAWNPLHPSGTAKARIPNCDDNPILCDFANTPTAPPTPTPTPTPRGTITIAGLSSSMQAGRSVDFDVTAWNLTASGNYTIGVTTNNSNVGFNSA